MVKGFFKELKEDLAQNGIEKDDDGKKKTQKNQRGIGIEIEIADPRSKSKEKQVNEDDDIDAFMNNVMQEMKEVKEKHANKKPVMNEKKLENVIDETAVITKGMNVKGNVTSKSSLDVMGYLEGDIDIQGKLKISGTVKGNSGAAFVMTDEGKIIGNIASSGDISIGEKSVVIGNINAINAVIDGAVKGDIDAKGNVVLGDSSIVMGNIKSKSVQINNGAVIEGLCSQCYADVNPTNFFEGQK